MTNKELAAHFASLPPDEQATVRILDADTAFIDDEIFVAATTEMLEEFNDEEFEDGSPTREETIGKPVILKKW